MKLNLSPDVEAIKPDHIINIKVIGLTPLEMKQRAVDGIPIDWSEIYASLVFSSSLDLLNMDLLMR